MNKIIKIVLPILFLAVLSNCATTSGSVVDDGSIESKLQRIYDNGTYKNSNIYASSYNGELLLTGQVPNAKTRNDVIFDARAMPGVNKIYDYMDIRLPQSITSKTTDTYTTTQVRGKIFNLDDVNSNSVKVITTNNVVYLFGVVTKTQATAIANAAASINGVEKVVTLFSYVNR